MRDRRNLISVDYANSWSVSCAPPRSNFLAESRSDLNIDGTYFSTDGRPRQLLAASAATIYLFTTVLWRYNMLFHHGKKAFFVAAWSDLCVSPRAVGLMSYMMVSGLFFMKPLIFTPLYHFIAFYRFWNSQQCPVAPVRMSARWKNRTQAKKIFPICRCP